MKWKTIFMQAAVPAAALILSSCASVTVKQDKPIEINVRVDIYEHAESVVDELTKPLPKNERPKSALEPSRTPVLVTQATSGGAERSLDEIKRAIRSRAEKVRALKTAGAIGEDSRGYLAVVDTKSKDAKAAVEAENADRKALYENEAVAAGKSINVVQDAYARAWHKSAEAGDWLEKDGKWIRK